MKAISYEELINIRKNNEDAPLINVLSADTFRSGHIPGSVNVPLENADFTQRVEALIGGKDKQVIVYCAKLTCDASRNAAAKLEAAGFTNVMAYEGGTQEWQEKSGSKQAA